MNMNWGVFWGVLWGDLSLRTPHRLCLSTGRLTHFWGVLSVISSIFFWKVHRKFVSLQRRNQSSNIMRNYRLSKQKRDTVASMPIIGPSSMEEAMERIDHGIQEMESGQGYSWDSVKAELLQTEEIYAG